MKAKQLVVFSSAVAVMVMLTIGVAHGMGQCGMGSGSHDQSGGSMACMTNAGISTDTASAMGCPMMIPGARMTVKNIRNGVQIELKGTNPAMIARIREHARCMLAMHNSTSDTGTGHGRTGAGHQSPPQVQTAAFTCPMHPEVVSAQPSRCPKCGMTLTPARR